MDLANQVIQLCLTVLGYPPTEVFPRIDLFSYASLALPFLLAAAAFFALLTNFRSVSAKALAALWFLIPYYSRSVYGAQIILVPDYHNWILPAGLLIVIVFARWDTYSGSMWTRRDAALLAGFAALSIAVKPTLAIYPGTIALAWLVSRPGLWNSLTKSASAALAGVAGFIVILLIFYRGNLSYLESFFNDQKLFISTSGQQSLAYSSWIRAYLFDSWLIGFAVFLPFAIASALYVIRDRKRVGPLVALGVGALLYQFILYARFTPATKFEAAIFVQCALTSLALTCLPKHRDRLVKTGVLLLILVSVGQLWKGARPLLEGQLATLAQNSRDSREVEDLIDRTSGNTTFLIPDNSFRPLIVDMAIFKGSRDISWRPISSRVMARMLPGREFLTESKAFYHSQPPDVTRFNQVLIAMGKGIDGAQRKRHMEEYYSVSLAPFDLYKRFDLGGQYLDVYRPFRPIIAPVPPDKAFDLSKTPVNANHAFATSTNSDPLGGFFISPDNSAGKITLERDAEGPYLRIVATRRSPYLVLNDLFYGKISAPDGLVVRTMVRGNCHGALRLTIFDVTDSRGSTESPIQTTPCSSEWVKMEVKKFNAPFSHPSDNYSVGLSDVQPGDWFEVRAFALYRAQPVSSIQK